MTKEDRISASHILIMHNEVDNSDATLSKEEALKLIGEIRDKLKKDINIFKRFSN